MGSESSGSSFRVVITMMRNFPSTSIVILNMMEYPPRGWSLSFYEVVDILFTIANAIIVSVPIVAPPPDPWYLPMLVSPSSYDSLSSYSIRLSAPVCL